MVYPPVTQCIEPIENVRNAYINATIYFLQRMADLPSDSDLQNAILSETNLAMRNIEQLVQRGTDNGIL